MSKNVEQRVVQMRFENDQFERGVRESTESLKKLDKALKFQNGDEARTGFEQLERSADHLNKIRFDGFIGSIKGIGNAITSMVKDVGIYNIGRQLESQLENTVKALTIQGPQAGWAAYETGVEAAQKIVNATGQDLDKITPKLDKLRIFSDETSYSYEAMSNTLGDFLANGGDLDESISAMMGIANAAGYAGVNATKATHAMTGFSKALGKGYMDQMSWSWIRTAGMNVQSFKQQLIESAVEVGTLKKSVDNAGKAIYKTLGGKEVSVEAFEANLAQKWLTKDAIMKTLNMYGDTANKVIDQYIAEGGEKEIRQMLDEMQALGEADGTYMENLGLRAFQASQQTKTLKDTVEALRTAVSSKWGKTWELIFGNFKEATELWGGFVEAMWGIFVTPGDKRNDMLAEWRAFKDEEGEIIDGRQILLEGISNVWQGLQGMIAPIQKALAALFPPMTAEKLIELTIKFRDLTAQFRDAFPILEETEEDIEAIGETAAEVVKPVFDTAEALDELAKAVIRGEYGNGAERVEKLGENFKLVQNKVNELLGCTFRYDDALDHLVGTTEDAAEATGEMADNAEKAGIEVDVTKRRMRNVENILLGLAGVLTVIKEALFGIGKIAVKVGFGFLKVLTAIADIFLDILGGFGKIRKETDKFDKFLEKFREFFDSIGRAVDLFFDGVAKAIRHDWELFVRFFKALSEHEGITKFKNTWVKSWELIKETTSKVMDVISNKFGESFAKFLKLFKKTKEDAEGNVEELEDVITPEAIADTIGNLIGLLADLIDTYLPKAVEWVGKLFDLFGGKNRENVEAVSEAVEIAFGDTSGMATSMAGVSRAIGKAESVNGFLQNLSKYKNAWGSWTDGLIAAFADGTMTTHFTDLMKGLGQIGAGAILVKVGLGMSTAAKGIGDFAAAAGKSTIDILSNMGGVLQSYQNKINAGSLLNVAKAIGLIALSLAGLSFIPTENLQTAGTVLTEVLLMVALIVKFYSKINKIGDTITNTSTDNSVNIQNAVTVVSDTVLTPLGEAIKSVGKSIAQSIRDIFRLPGIAMLLVAFAGSLVVVFNTFRKAIEYFKEFGEDDMPSLMLAAEVLGGIATAITAMVSIMALIVGTFTNGGGQMLSAALAVVAIAFALGKIFEALKTLTDMQLDKTIGSDVLKEALLELIALMLSIGAAAGLAGASGIKGLIAFAGAMYVMGKLLPSLADGLMAFNGVKLGNVLKLGGMMTVLVLSIMGLKFALGKIKASFKDVFVLAAALAAVAGGVYLFGKADAKGIENMNSALIGLVLAVWALAAAGTVLGPGLKLVFDTIGNNILNIGVGVIAFAGGVWLLSYAFNALAASLPVLGTGISEFGKAVKEHWVVAIGLAVLLGVALFNLTKVVDPISKAISGVIGWFEKLSKSSEDTENKTGGFLKRLPGIIGTMLKTLGILMIIAAPGVVDFLVNLLVTIIDSFATAITNNGTKIIAALWHVITAILGLLFQAIGMAGDWLTDNGFSNFFNEKSFMDINPNDDWFARMDKGMFNWAKNLVPHKEDYEKAADQSAKDYEETMEELEKRLGDKRYDVRYAKPQGGGSGLSVLNLVKPSVEAAEQAGTETGTVYGNAVPEGILQAVLNGDFSAVTEAIQNGVINEEEFGSLMSQLGVEGKDQLLSSLTNLEGYGEGDTPGVFQTIADKETEYVEVTAVPTFQEKADQITDAVLKELETRAEDVADAGTAHGTAYADALGDTSDLAAESTRTINDAILLEVENYYEPMYSHGESLGTNLMNGLLSGIDKKASEVTARISNLTKSMNTTFETEEEINSPSKRWAGYGRYLMLGLANSITQFSSLVTGSISTLADDAESAITPALSYILDSLAGDLDSAPVIRPVLDLTDVNNGASRINGMLGGTRSYDLAVQANEARLYSQYKAMETAYASSTGLADRIVNGVVSGITGVAGENGQIDVHIHLEPNNAELFKVVRAEANRFTRATGYSPFNNGK